MENEKFPMKSDFAKAMSKSIHGFEMFYMAISF